jgi:hypothetical protein
MRSHARRQAQLTQFDGCHGVHIGNNGSQSSVNGHFHEGDLTAPNSHGKPVDEQICMLSLKQPSIEH